jgi:hypothetical protein
MNLFIISMTTITVEWTVISLLLSRDLYQYTEYSMQVCLWSIMYQILCVYFKWCINDCCKTIIYRNTFTQLPYCYFAFQKKYCKRFIFLEAVLPYIILVPCIKLCCCCSNITWLHIHHFVIACCRKLRNTLYWIWKEAVMAFFYVLYEHLPVGMWGNHEEPNSG